MIILDKIDVFFNQGTALFKHALKNISLSINEGDFVTVIGSNGAGKSTLLNTISGEISISSGKLLIDEHGVTHLSSYDRANEVARVFQDPLSGTCSDLTIAENLSLAKSRGLQRGLQFAITKEDREYFSEILSTLKLGLHTRLDMQIGLLSGGQRQAISLLMATISPLKILLLDEHTSALDPKTADFVMELTQEMIASKKLTALMVTHSLNQALHYGNRTLMLHNGQIISDISNSERQNLTPKDLLEKFGQNIDNDRMLFSNA